MDILLVGGLDFTPADAALPQMGQEILKVILSEDYEVELVNFDHLHQSGRLPYATDIEESLERMTAHLLSRQAKVIGFYTICNSFITVVELARRIREGDPQAIIVFGGPHATVTAEACLRELPFVDAVCCGESEKSILPLMRTLIDGGDLSAVPGIAFRREGSIVQTPPAPLLEDEELGRYTVFDHGPGWKVGPDDGAALEGGRGCPWGCTFCSTNSFWGRRFRIKPVATLLAEMNRFHELYGTTAFAIQHDIFTARRAHLMDFCEALIAAGSPYKWRCSSRIDVLDKEVIALMARAGCIQMYLGLETGSARMQRILNKNLNLQTACERVRELTEAGIFTITSFIYGFLEETEDDFLQTIAVTEQLYLAGNRSFQLHRFFPLPATEETAKIYDIAYFDENDVDLSIFNRKVICDEGRRLITEHKDLFLQFYTFKSENRAKYPWIESVSLFLSSISEGFYETGKCLVRRYGIIQLYFRYEELFHEISLQFSNIVLDGELKEFFFDYLSRLVQADGTAEVAEIFRYEKLLLAYAASERKEPEVHLYALDVLRAMREGIYESGETSIMFWRERESGALRANVVPQQLGIL
jgi:radical SAM superfamily enzyme YgiQ (UPF0313 family)